VRRSEERRLERSDSSKSPILSIETLQLVTLLLATAPLQLITFYSSLRSSPRDIAQAFVVLLPVKSVGVMGDGRTYENVASVRCVTTTDFMTAEFYRMPYDLMETISNRIINEVRGINRVAYDISSKPPATVEWE